MYANLLALHTFFSIEPSKQPRTYGLAGLFYLEFYWVLGIRFEGFLMVSRSAQVSKGSLLLAWLLVSARRY